MTEMSPETTKEEVIARLADWKARLEQLFAQVEEWAGQLPQFSGEPPKILKGASLQLVEDMMEEFDVQPDLVPNLAIIYGRNRISFVPMGLWVNAANGRVNVITNDYQYILVDLGGENDQPSEWVIVSPRARNEQIPLSFEVLRNLIQTQALKAA